MNVNYHKVLAVFIWC